MRQRIQVSACATVKWLVALSGALAQAGSGIQVSVLCQQPRGRKYCARIDPTAQSHMDWPGACNRPVLQGESVAPWALSINLLSKVRERTLQSLYYENPDF